MGEKFESNLRQTFKIPKKKKKKEKEKRKGRYKVRDVPKPLPGSHASLQSSR
jgi:hypothetical protein